MSNSHIPHNNAYWIKALIYERFLVVHLLLCGFLRCILSMQSAVLIYAMPSPWNCVFMSQGHGLD